jgi:hypothetical protein
VSDIFREVDEDVRHEQMLKLWRKYGKFAVAAAVAVAIGVGGGASWKQYRHSQRLAEGAEFTASLELLARNQSAAAAERFAALADDSDTGYASLARLREAEALAAAGDAEGALAVLDRLADDGGADQSLRNLARLLGAYRLVDSAPLDEMERRLGPLLQDDSPWHATARELVGLTALRIGDTGRARELFAGLAADDSAPPAIRGRAAELLEILGGG